MRSFLYQLKQAFLSLQKKLGFVSTVVITMGTTLGALLCVLTLGYLLIVEPLPYPDQSRLYNVVHHIGDDKGEINATSYTYPGLTHMYKNQDVFEKAAMVQYASDVLTSLPHQPTLSTTYVTPEWFELLGTTPIMGRRFEQTEALDTFNPVAIISYDTWQKEFNGASDVLSYKISFSGVSFSIIGVLGKNFVEPEISQIGNTADVWLPFDYNQDSRLADRWGNISGSLFGVGKLKQNISASQAEQLLTPLVNDIWRENVAGSDFFKNWSIEMEMVSFKNAIVGESTDTVYKLLAGVIGLVLIALTNIANLFMSRTAEKQRQLSIYAALGAKKSQLFRGLLAESGLLMTVSLLVALVIASLGFNLLQSYLNTELPRVNELSINVFTLGCAVLIALVCALIFALLSSKMINYRALNTSLQTSGKGTGVQVSKRLRQSLIVLQVAIATTLVFANAALFKDAIGTIHQDHGYRTDNMVEVGMSISSVELPSREQLTADMGSLVEQLFSLPQVEAVSHTISVISGYGLWALTNPANNERFTPESKSVSHNYFSMVGQPLIEGDYFTEADIKDNNRVMIVNDVFAKRINPNGSALGVQISSDAQEPNYTIVGVVKGVTLPGQSEVPMRVYSPSSSASTFMTVKLVEGQTISREEVVSSIREVSSQYALYRFNPLEDIKRNMLFTQYTTAVTTAGLAFITLFLASIGLYGILSYSTQMRRFELGTRMAIGARRSTLISLIIKDNVWVVLLGIAISVITMLVLFTTNQELLQDYMRYDLIPLFIATLIAISVLSLFACYWPLRQFINRPAIHSLRGSD